MKKKLDRDQRLYRYHLAHPKMSYAAIGRVFHIKHRQQVGVIIKRLKENKADADSN